MEKLTDLVSDKGHDKHLHYKECKEMGLEIRMLEEPGQKTLQDLILTVHHCYMFTLANTPAFKLIENHTGRRYVKIEQHMVVMQSPQKPPGLLGPGGPAH